MKILVTGSEGLIGRPLCRMLEERGDVVKHFDKATNLHHDIYDPSILRRILGNERQFDVVIHLAAMSGVEAARDNPRTAWTVNVFGTFNVLEACRRSKTPVVIASSNHIYGHGEEPVAEDGVQLQLDTYSATKHAADVMARSYAHNYNLPVAVVRNTNCFGPDSPHLDHIIEGTIKSLIDGETPVIKSNGETVKSYLYVNDVAKAYMMVADFLINESTTPEAITVNVSGDRISVLDLVKVICLIDGKGISPKILGEPNDQRDEWLDDSLIREVIGWKPEVSLDSGLKMTYEGLVERFKKPSDTPTPPEAQDARPESGEVVSQASTEDAEVDDCKS